MRQHNSTFNIDVPRAAVMAGVSDQTIRRLIELGVFRTYRYTPRGKWWISYESIVNYIQHLASGGTIEQYLDKLRREKDDEEKVQRQAERQAAQKANRKASKQVDDTLTPRLF
jgi:hypothetical protein